MFVGHYAVALVATAAEPRAPLWATVVGVQLVDIGWGGLVIAGVERARVDPSLPGSPLILDHMPWTHSLPMALVWSVAAFVAARTILRLPARVGIVVGLTVLSHWFLDLLVHRPDLELWVGGDKVGLAWWDFPVAEQALEIGLLALGAIALAANRRERGLAAWPVAALVAFLVALQIGVMFLPLHAGPMPWYFAAGSLSLYLTAAAIAAITEIVRAPGVDGV